MNLDRAIKTIATFSTIENLNSDKHHLDTISRLEKEFETKLPTKLKSYIQNVAPKTDLHFDTVGNPMRLYSTNSLKKAQDGYNYNSVSNTKIDGWPNHYFIIADEGADPVVIDLNNENTTVTKLTHGSGSWEYGETIADSIGQFLLCSAAQHHALNNFEEEVIVDDKNGFCLAPNAANWYFKQMQKWAGAYYSVWCSIFDNS